MEAAGAAETLVPIFEIARRHIPDDDNFLVPTFIDPCLLLLLYLVIYNTVFVAVF
jgi:hypothetical protein